MREVLGDLGRIVGGWVCWRPWRLVVTVIGTLLVATLVASFTGGPDPTPKRHRVVAAPATTEVPVSTPPVPAPVASSVAPVVPSTVPASSAAPSVVANPQHLGVGATAVAFTRAWVNTSHGKTAWLSGMDPYVTAHLRAQFAQGDPGAVPASAVTGPARIGEAGGQGLVSVSVPTDTFPALLTLTRVAGLWLVSDINMNRVQR